MKKSMQYASGWLVEELMVAKQVQPLEFWVA